MHSWVTNTKALISISSEDFESDFIKAILRRRNDRYALMALQRSIIKCCFINQRVKDNLILNINQLILVIP